VINIENIKKEIVTALIPLDPKKIILFGSYAYGNPTEDSDLDICVVEESYTNKFKEKTKIRELLSNIDISIDILNPKVEEYEFYKNEYGSVYKDIEDRGILLWNS